MHIGEGQGCPEIPHSVAVGLTWSWREVRRKDRSQEPPTAGVLSNLGFPTPQQDRLHLPVLPLLHPRGAGLREPWRAGEGAGARRAGVWQQRCQQRCQRPWTGGAAPPAAGGPGRKEPLPPGAPGRWRVQGAPGTRVSPRPPAEPRGTRC